MDICIIQVENIQHFLLTSKPFPKWFSLYLIPIKFYNSSSHLIENTWYFQTVKFLPSGSCKKDLIGIICNSRIPIKISIFPLKKKKKEWCPLCEVRQFGTKGQRQLVTNTYSLGTSWDSTHSTSPIPTLSLELLPGSLRWVMLPFQHPLAVIPSNNNSNPSLLPPSRTWGLDWSAWKPDFPPLSLRTIKCLAEVGNFSLKCSQGTYPALSTPLLLAIGETHLKTANRL